MYTAAELDEYLAEIRTQVCANCVEQPAGGPPCEPLGKMCGVEQHLPELIDAVHGAFSGSIVPYFESKQRQVCDHCSFRQSRSCPCPMDYLLVLVVEAVEAVDARHERRHKGRLRLAGLGGADGADIREIHRLYDEAAGTWTGCDWSTTFGKSALDLNGWTAADARKKASTSKAAVDAENFEAAAEWLERIERLAEGAEGHAARAVRAASSGAWREAIEEAHLAWASEFATGRLIWRGFPMTWQRLHLAVSAAASLHPNATEADQATVFS
jgi:hypothetical protein